MGKKTFTSKNSLHFFLIGLFPLKGKLSKETVEKGNKEVKEDREGNLSQIGISSL